MEYTEEEHHRISNEILDELDKFTEKFRTKYPKLAFGVESSDCRRFMTSELTIEIEFPLDKDNKNTRLSILSPRE